MIDIADKEAQRAFLDRFYGWAGPIYDVTRKYYLLGRDPAIDALLSTQWSRLVEVGPGTGRNLEQLHRRRPFAALGGVEPSREMLRRVRRRCPFARLVEGFAEDCDHTELVGGRPERIFFSYCLSMVGDPNLALDNARSQVAPGGRVVVVDFGDLTGVPGWFGRGLRRWLDAFHVHPLDLSLLDIPGTELRFGPGRYWVYAEIPGS